jgi:uncharacterized protein (DUF1800 family)
MYLSRHAAVLLACTGSMLSLAGCGLGASGTGAPTPVQTSPSTPVVISGSATQVAGTTNTFLVDVKGTGFVSGSVINAGGGQTTTVVSSTELQTTVPVGLSVGSLVVSVTNPSPSAATSNSYTITIASKSTTATAAARLLDQATFGPTAADIQHVEAIGIDAWINEQFADTPTTMPSFDPNNPPAYCVSTSPWTCIMTPWWQAAVTAPDQLRQRVAFAYSQMFVASMLSNGQNVYSTPQYQNVMINDAFANFATTMHDVTLTPDMGLYLNMLNSAKPVAGAIANENYARENMQLFTIGLNLLNPDGSVQTDGSGNPIPAYTQAQVQAFAHAYTGWTWASASGGAPSKFPNPTANYNSPMGAYEAQHDTASKTLLNGTVLPAGQTAEQDLDGALNNLFTHPNIGPFISKELIQHFVTSTPSPAYVSRISAVFANNGSGVRGDIKAVMRAILEDDEARTGDTIAEYNGGHLREPVLFVTAMLRGLGFTNTSSTGAGSQLSSLTQPLNEDPYRSPSVFNFFAPDYTLPITNINAPEFGIENTATVILRVSLANSFVFNQISGFTVNLSATSTLGTMAANPGTLVDYLGGLMMHSQMPTAMRTQIINTITPMTNNATRVRFAIFLIATSSEYKVIH